MSSHGYLTSLERERDELELEARRMRMFALVAGVYAFGLSVAVVVTWALVVLGGVG